MVIDRQNKLHGIPFLGHRCDKKMFFAFCRSCVQQRSSNLCPKSHDRSSRLFRDFFTLPEIHYCLTQLGGHQVTLLEVYFYKKQAPIFKLYYKTLAAFKCSFEAPPKNVADNPSALKAYLDDLNQRLDLHEPTLKLQPQHIRPNASLRANIKQVTTRLYFTVCYMY